MLLKNWATKPVGRWQLHGAWKGIRQWENTPTGIRVFVSYLFPVEFPRDSGGIASRRKAQQTSGRVGCSPHSERRCSSRFTCVTAFKREGMETRIKPACSLFHIHAVGNSLYLECVEGRTRGWWSDASYLEGIRAESCCYLRSIEHTLA